MSRKVFWVSLAIIDAIILYLWVHMPAFYTWHGMVVVFLGGILGATFDDCWLEQHRS